MQESSVSDFERDEILGTRYRVISLLGRGGMGVVYKVEQIFLGKELALKTIVKSEQTEFVLRRFKAEARAVFSLHHPNIVAVHDFGLLDDHTPFMAMEIISGKTLGDILQERRLSVEEAIPLFIQICFGLAHAHENGIVHRDIKPNNIMIVDGLPWGTEGSVKILDFGIAKLTQHEGGEIQALTRTGEIFGSPFYMSPEQCLGTKIDHRSDIYSLGCVLFEALTGNPPFVGDNALNTMMMHQQNFCPSLKEAAGKDASGKEFPSELEDILQTMLAKDPADRYQNLGLAAHELADLQRGEKSNISSAVKIARPSRPPVKAPDMVQVERSHFIGTLVATALLFSLGTATVMQMQHQKDVAVPRRLTSTDVAFQRTDLPTLDDNTKPTRNGVSDKLREQTGLEDGDEPNKTDTRPTSFDANQNSAEGPLNDASMGRYKKQKDLQYLDLSGSKVTDAGFKNLIGSKLLRLVLANDKSITTVDEISKLNYLQSLNLENTRITDSALSKLVRLPMLDQIDISGCNNLTQKGLMELTKSKSLVYAQLPDGLPRQFVAELQAKLPQCAFRTYFDKSNLEKEQESAQNLNDLQKAELVFATVSKANPLSRYAAVQLISMAEKQDKLGHHKESWDLVKRAEKISETTKDLDTLKGALIAESLWQQAYGSKPEAVKLREKSVQIDVDTTLHSERRLIERLWQASILPASIGQYEKSIRFLKMALAYLDQYREKNQDYVPVLCERISWCSYLEGHPERAEEYARRNVAYWREHRNSKMPTEETAYHEPPNFLYARSLVEMGHSAHSTADSKKYYDEALDLLDSMGLPELINLKEHYCDACDHIAHIYEAEGNRSEAVKYLKRALAAAKRMTYKDPTGRAKYFAGRIVEDSQPAKMHKPTPQNSPEPPK